MEPHAQEPDASEAAGTEEPLRGTGAVGRKLSRMVRTTGSERMPDEPGGRCDQHDVSPHWAEETIWAAAGVLRAWIETYGVPQALYTDWKNVYVREPTEKEQLRGEVPVTQFGRMCERLGIRIIAASSPEAKGRVERNHGTHQDRLVKKLRLKKIGSYEAANRYLAEQYLAEHNRRFAIEPAAEEDYHVKAPSRAQLDDVFRLESERVIGNDWVVRYESRYFQVERYGRHHAPAKGKVTVCEWEDGRLEIRYRGAKVALGGDRGTAAAAEVAQPCKSALPYGGTPPKTNHPWKQRYDGMPDQSLAKHQIRGSEVVADGSLRCALSARPTASQGFASGAVSKTGREQAKGTFLMS